MSKKYDESYYYDDGDEEQDFKYPPQQVPWSNPNEELASHKPATSNKRKPTHHHPHHHHKREHTTSQVTGPGTATAESRGYRRPFTFEEARPGAVVIPGVDVKEEYEDQDTVTTRDDSTINVVARVVDTQMENQRLRELDQAVRDQERIRHERDQFLRERNQLRRIMDNAVVVDPVVVTNRDVQNTNEEVSQGATHDGELLESNDRKCSSNMVNTNARAKDMHVLGCRGCCNFPNGKKMGIAAVCVSIIGFILAISGTYTCNFLEVQVTDYYGSVDEESFFGIFAYNYLNYGCLSYDDYDKEYFGGAIKFARAMAVLATILGSLALFGTLSLSCMSMPNLILKIVSILYLISALCVILTLVMFAECDTDALCSVGPGAALAIVAPFFYVASAIIVYKIPLYRPAEKETKPTKPEQAPKRYVRVKKTVKTTIDKYGNKTVEETIEEPPEDLYPTAPEEEVGVETGKSETGRYREWDI